MLRVAVKVNKVIQDSVSGRLRLICQKIPLLGNAIYIRFEWHVGNCPETVKGRGIPSWGLKIPGINWRLSRKGWAGRSGQWWRREIKRGKCFYKEEWSPLSNAYERSRKIRTIKWPLNVTLNVLPNVVQFQRNGGKSQLEWSEERKGWRGNENSNLSQYFWKVFSNTEKYWRS